MHSSEVAPPFLMFTGWFFPTQMQWCWRWTACLVRMHAHSTEISSLPAVMCWILLGWMMWSHQVIAPFGVRWSHCWEVTTDEESAAVWLGWSVEIYGVYILRRLRLRCLVGALYSLTLKLFHIIGRPSSLGSLHNFLWARKLGVPRLFYSCILCQSHQPPGWNLSPCFGVSKFLEWSWMVRSCRGRNFPWAPCGKWYTQVILVFDLLGY